VLSANEALAHRDSAENLDGYPLTASPLPRRGQHAAVREEHTAAFHIHKDTDSRKAFNHAIDRDEAALLQAPSSLHSVWRIPTSGLPDFRQLRAMIKLEGGTGSPACGSVPVLRWRGFFALIHESGHAAGLYAASLYLRRSFTILTELLLWAAILASQLATDHVGLGPYALNRCLFLRRATGA